MSPSGQQGIPGRVPTGGQQGMAGGGRGGTPVHYAPIDKYSSPSDLRITDIAPGPFTGAWGAFVIVVILNER